MKTLLSTILVLAAFVAASFGQVSISDEGQSEFYFAITTNLDSGASFTYTNAPTSISNENRLIRKPFTIGSIAVLADGPNTNTFVIKQLRDIKYNLYQGNVVSTNQFGEVETNWYNSITGTVSKTMTNILYSSMAYTNTGAVVGSEQLPEKVYFLAGDRLIVTISNTRSAATWMTLYGLR